MVEHPVFPFPERLEVEQLIVERAGPPLSRRGAPRNNPDNPASSSD